MPAALALPVAPAPTPAPATPVVRPLLDVAPDELRAWLADRDQPPMRVGQIRRWVLERRATSFDAMTDLPLRLRADLATHFAPLGTAVDKHLTAADGTHKLLVRLADGRQVECVLIQDQGRATACISTQVGCGMGCVFCASGLNGMERNLSAGEMLEQLIRLRNLTDPTAGGERAPRLTNVVLMGMGEPLANLDNLLAALDVAGRKGSLDIGARHVTISTVGLPAKMRRLAEVDKQYNLAVSLHAPSDELRTRIVPTNKGTGIADILAAADHYFATTGRRVTYEYVVLGGLNDQPPHARQLAGLLRGRHAHVNLIPWNAVGGMPFASPHPDDLRGLIDTLRRGGVSTTVRQRRGADIDAACGQLRRDAQNVNREVL